MNDDWTKLVEKQDILEYMIFLYNFFSMSHFII